MEVFKMILFGISGLSLIFWVCVVAIWHVDMLPRIFATDSLKGINSNISQGGAFLEGSTLTFKGSLRPNKNTKSLKDRGKYSMRSFVFADFSPVEEDYGVNRLYTSIILSLGVMSFITVTYGLHSGLNIS